ncbi:FAD-dependent oxidoreductase [Phaeobacter sp. J2-8]|uniref:NAD(P)/FAD-dependent oxidoreductase n=1 Tax=Phaeobacter sp. J2-8 TaxID=2931394 RepID=UPI001FD4D56B|nr:FAD-binding oxidoreductase [Phaeobacter sp. J2-8]
MTDIVIIGGGIAGVSAAARLAAHGTVTLLEAEDHLAYHASGRSAAMFLDSYGNAVVQALNRASAPYLHQSDGGVLRPRNMLLVAGPDQAAQFSHDAAELALTEIPMADARAQVPILNPATCGFAASGPVFDLDTDLLLQNFRRRALADGATLLTGSRVTALTRRGGRWHLDTQSGAHTADIVINAAGAWADKIAGLAGAPRIGLQPMRRSMARIPAPGGQDVRDWPFLLAAGDAWYAKPEAGSLLISPADEDPLPPQDAWADDMVLAEGLARYEAMVTEPVTRVTANWAGLRTFAPDRTLVVGACPTTPGFFWLAGQGGYGFQTAVATSQLIADFTLERAPALAPHVVAALDPGRFA